MARTILVIGHRLSVEDIFYELPKQWFGQFHVPQTVACGR